MMYNNFAGLMSGGPFWGLGFGLFALTSLLLIILALGVIALKGYALWTAAKRDDKGWFIALLLINTIGILELFYLYVIVGKWKDPKPSTTTPASTTNVPFGDGGDPSPSGEVKIKETHGKMVA